MLDNLPGQKQRLTALLNSLDEILPYIQVTLEKVSTSTTDIMGKEIKMGTKFSNFRNKEVLHIKSTSQNAHPRFERVLTAPG